MTETHHDQHHHGPGIKAYLAVFGALMVFTVMSFVANLTFGHGSPTAFLIILIVAVFKATLVGVYFMHLILDWPKLYVLIIPALILGPLLVVVIWPDTVLAWQRMYSEFHTLP